MSFFMTLGQGYQNESAACRRIEEIFSLPPDINGTKILAGITEINLRGLTYTIGGRKIFSGFNRRFVRGKIYCIVGANSAGKSTLMNLICGMIRPASGAGRQLIPH